MDKKEIEAKGVYKDVIFKVSKPVRRAVQTAAGRQDTVHARWCRPVGVYRYLARRGFCHLIHSVVDGINAFLVFADEYVTWMIDRATYTHVYNTWYSFTTQLNIERYVVNSTSKQASNFIRQNNEKNTNILLNHEYYTFGGLPVKLSLILAGHLFY